MLLVSRPVLPAIPKILLVKLSRRAITVSNVATLSPPASSAGFSLTGFLLGVFGRLCLFLCFVGYGSHNKGAIFSWQGKKCAGRNMELMQAEIEDIRPNVPACN
jgi:hypothetical protein